MSGSDHNIGLGHCLHYTFNKPVSQGGILVDADPFAVDDPRSYQVVGYARFTLKNIREMPDFTREDLMRIVGFVDMEEVGIHLILVNNKDDIGKTGPICPTKEERDGGTCYAADGFCLYA